MDTPTSKRKSSRSSASAIRGDNQERLSVEELERALEIELRHLRALLREVTANYISVLEADIERVVGAIGHKDRQEKKYLKSRQTEIRDILDRIRALNVKPKKGRRKDIKRIDKLIGELTKWADNCMGES